MRDALHAKANFLGKIGDREAAAKAYKETEDKTASGGSKADMVFSQIRWALLAASGLARSTSRAHSTAGGVGRARMRARQRATAVKCCSFLDGCSSHMSSAVPPAGWPSCTMTGWA